MRIGRIIGAGIAAGFVLSSLAIAGPQSQPAAPTVRNDGQRPQLVEVAHPDLTRVDVAVREQILEAQTRLDRTLPRPEANPAQLSEAYGDLGMLYHAYDLTDAALTSYRNAAELDPKSFRWHYYLGRLYQQAGQLGEAIANYERAESLRPGDVPTLLGFAEACLDASQPERAAKLYGKVLSQDNRSAAALVGLGKIALTAGQYQLTVERLEAALAIAPEASSIHYSLGLAYRHLGDRQKAQQHLSKHGASRPPAPDPLMEQLEELKTGRRTEWARGSQAFQDGNYSEAADHYRLMVEENPKDPMARMYLGTALAQLGQPEEAVGELNRALQLAPGNARIHYLLGVLLIQLGSDTDATEHLRAAVRADPGMKDARFHLANELMRSGRFDEAVEQYSEVSNLDPTNGFARLMHAMGLIRSQEYPQAKKVLEESFAALPDDVDIAHALARLLAASPDKEQRDGLRAIQLLAPTFKDASASGFEQVQTLAMALAEVGKFAEAIKFQQALVHEAENAGRSRLAQLLREDLQTYQQGQACRRPWSDDDPVFSPVLNGKESLTIAASGSPP